MEVVLFDLDGTILDTSTLITRSLRWAMESTGSDLSRLEDFTWGLPLSEVLCMMCPGRERDAFREYQEHYRTHRHLVTPFPGMRQTIDGLSREGFRMAVVTTKGTAPATQDLSACGLIDVFELIVGADDVQRLKPDPEPVLRALKAMGARPDQAVMIGDTPADIGAGQAAGTATGAVLWGPDREMIMSHGGADVYFDDPPQILSWCRSQATAGPPDNRGRGTGSG